MLPSGVTKVSNDGKIYCINFYFEVVTLKSFAINKLDNFDSSYTCLLLIANSYADNVHEIKTAFPLNWF